MKKIDSSTEMPQVGVEAQLAEGMSVAPSNNSGRIHRLGFLEIIEDDTEKVEVDTEGMTSEELDALRIWEIEKAANEGRMNHRFIFLSGEELKRMGFTLYDSSNRVVEDCSLQGAPSATNEKKGWHSLRPASRPNKNKGKTYYSFFINNILKFNYYDESRFDFRRP